MNILTGKKSKKKKKKKKSKKTFLKHTWERKKKIY